jgi:hypothetical protein
MKDWLLRFYHRLPVIRDLQDIKATLNKGAHDRLIASATAFQALKAIRDSDERYRDPKRLLVHGAQYWSQNYEDGMIAEIFKRIGTTSRTFLEIGVGDGSENNTVVLLSAGWTGWWIEGDPICCASIERQLRQMPKTARRLKLKQAFVSPDNIQHLLAELGVPEEIDLFSLDIDLNTYHIWKALANFRPRVVVVEYNGAFPPGQSWIHPLRTEGVWDYTQGFGASLKAFEELGTRFGYYLVGCDITGINAFFVRKDLVKDQFPTPFTSENHYEPPRYYLYHRFAHPPKFFVENHGETDC